MNRIPRDVDVTFRRDPDTKRPRINKRGSTLDREQRSKGEYYYGLHSIIMGDATEKGLIPSQFVHS
ncbi:MAG: hypothetical protein KAU14_04085 [Thermoplasmata archaeon]|nr:hypothetical protein [Thermoplasmata archaeon]